MRRTPIQILLLAAFGLARCSGGDDQGNRFEPDSPSDALEVTTDVILVPPDAHVDGQGDDGLAPDVPRIDTASDASLDGCVPGCDDRECGPDGCGHSCGDCAGAGTCNEAGHCVATCPPACGGRQCGDDGCGGSCGTCGVDLICTSLGHCATAPTCTEVTKIGCCDGDLLWACEEGAVVPTACPSVGGCGWLDTEGAYGCGGDGLAGPHGAFPLDCPWACHPLCVGQECGDDGCGGSCGTCPEGSTCDFAGACCAPSCLLPGGETRQCGGDGCGGSCGTCGLGEVCSGDGSCESPCANACDGRECGPDGCGGLCGTCDPGLTCTDAGACVDHCTAACQGKACGGDGCGGSCGACPAGKFCNADGTCGTTCAPDCLGKACGPDGCGGSCGTCEGDLLCTLDQACGSSCLDCGFAPECLTFGFESGNLLGWSTAAEPLVIPALGATPAPVGSYMLDLDTAGEGGDNDGATVQTCVPDGALTLHFLWRLYSEEFKEFCGTQYQDYFRVTVGFTDGHAVVFERTIDQLCPKGSCVTCGTYEVPLAASDVGFDQGDAWVTPWQAANVPLVDVLPGGGVISVTFEAGDEGDSIYDTHILVDQVRLVKGCEAACTNPEGVAKQCGDDGCGGLCGACEAGHPCGANGLCGACQPQCAGKACGPDGCGGACGTCDEGLLCEVGACVACQPQCGAKACGDDGCGGVCGTCAEGTVCSTGACVAAGGLGSPCATDADCTDILSCLPTMAGGLPGSANACTLACDVFTGGSCPDGWTCFPNLAGGDPIGYCVQNG